MVEVFDGAYEWVDDWAQLCPDELGGVGWAHHDLVVTADQRVIGFQSGGEAVCIWDCNGNQLGNWMTGLLEGHGMTVAGAPDAEQLWIADPGLKMVPNSDGTYEVHQPGDGGSVVRFDLSGTLQEPLPPPDHADYRDARYAPTAVAVESPDGSGAVWVADGYGAGLVHRFSGDGDLLFTLTGQEGAGRFDCPHSIFIDRRAGEPRLYVTDRGNGRIQVYDLDGNFLHVVTDGLVSPSALATDGDRLIVAELHARLTVLDRDDQVVGYVGRDDDAPDREAWPNAQTDDGRTVRPPDLAPGRFNSPHGLAVDANGDLYVAEWLIGGRLTGLRRRP